MDNHNQRRKYLWLGYGRALLTIGILGIITVGLYITANTVKEKHLHDEFIAREKREVSSDFLKNKKELIKNKIFDSSVDYISEIRSELVNDKSFFDTSDINTIKTSADKVLPVSLNNKNIRKRSINDKNDFLTNEFLLSNNDEKVVDINPLDEILLSDKIDAGKQLNKDKPKNFLSGSPKNVNISVNNSIEDELSPNNNIELESDDKKRSKKQDIIIREDSGVYYHHKRKECLPCKIKPKYPGSKRGMCYFFFNRFLKFFFLSLYICLIR